MFRAIFGLIKGLIVGGAVGFALLKLGATSHLGSTLIYGACAVVGALVGLVCGRAPWKSNTAWTSVIKAIVGAGIGAGLGALGLKLVPDIHLFQLPGIASLDAQSIGTHTGAFLTVAVGVLYGMFVEVDDGGAAETERKALPGKKS